MIMSALYISNGCDEDEEEDDESAPLLDILIVKSLDQRKTLESIKHLIHEGEYLLHILQSAVGFLKRD